MVLSKAAMVTSTAGGQDVRLVPLLDMLDLLPAGQRVGSVNKTKQSK